MNADQREALTREFAAIINRHSIENDTNTPDFILARALVGYLEELERLIMTRANWYGRIDVPGRGSIPYPETDEEQLRPRKRRARDQDEIFGEWRDE